MTKKRAERLTGYEVRQLDYRDRESRVAYGTFVGDELITEAAGATDELALQVLVRQVYRLHSLKTLAQYEGRCARCHRVKRLQIHHRQYRSHGGTHRLENLEPVCWDCHHVIHALERSK
jgi:hypothetical protein